MDFRFSDADDGASEQQTKWNHRLTKQKPVQDQISQCS